KRFRSETSEEIRKEFKMFHAFLVLLIMSYGTNYGSADYTDQELKQLCHGHQFEFMAHPDVSKYI
ncbi:hypothetical protein DOY81_015541, partial [Sarcophaga bullata]